METNKKNSPAPKPSVRRLPTYLLVLNRAEAEGLSHLSSKIIANELGLEPIQVRKDLAMTGLAGMPKVGFEIVPLIEAIKNFLGWNNTTDAFIVGAGNLGLALAGYSGFREYGLNIVALFDNDKKKIGKIIQGKSVFCSKKMVGLARRMHVRLGILAVSPEAAREMADLMVRAGIKAIWNFTPVTLDVGDDIIVERVDLAASLALLSNRLAAKWEASHGT
jgi:redox-sensing transcriptional repressor